MPPTRACGWMTRAGGPRRTARRWRPDRAGDVVATGRRRRRRSLQAGDHGATRKPARRSEYASIRPVFGHDRASYRHPTHRTAGSAAAAARGRGASARPSAPGRWRWRLRPVGAARSGGGSPTPRGVTLGSAGTGCPAARRRRLGTVAALRDRDYTEVIGVAARDAEPPAAPFRPAVPVAHLRCPVSRCTRPGTAAVASRRARHRPGRRGARQAVAVPPTRAPLVFTIHAWRSSPIRRWSHRHGNRSSAGAPELARPSRPPGLVPSRPPRGVPGRRVSTRPHQDRALGTTADALPADASPRCVAGSACSALRCSSWGPSNRARTWRGWSQRSPAAPVVHRPVVVGPVGWNEDLEDRLTMLDGTCIAVPASVRAAGRLRPSTPGPPFLLPEPAEGSACPCSMHCARAPGLRPVPPPGGGRRGRPAVDPTDVGALTDALAGVLDDPDRADACDAPVGSGLRSSLGSARPISPLPRTRRWP